ncbi:initiation factor 2B [Natrarchaeobius halalkaliphilus]|uniref:Initiation factor 2B n=1 Tax=Natrarchaeobius halalkaliphilus TaxID=1679091 RepID=A0A3N6LVE6_9EURY|nr:initiation factor 2B [Natrarchaeobius halalkaliphilus]RQG92687.1 initiation factor 2B [Natrarchaeobius halalkaliphilus]
MTDSTRDDGSEPSHVVTAFVRNRGEILLVRRSDAVGSHVGRWDGVSGFAEGRPDERVRTEIREKTGLEDGVSLVRSGRPVEFEDPDLDRERIVRPFLFDCDTREVKLSDEHDAFEWRSPTATVDPSDGRETVPKLWTAYERVAPTARSVAADDEHGAAFLSLRALEVVRDRAGVLVAERAEGEPDGSERNTHESDGAETRSDAEWNELAELAGRVLETRPSMAVLRNRVNRAMADADRTDDHPPGGAAVLESAISGIERAAAADEDAAVNGGERIDGTVLTLSRSGTVLDALREGSPSRVFVSESRPGREGVGVAETLASDSVLDCSVTVHTDAAAAHVLATEAVDRVVVGADTVRPDGAVVNKTGTRAVSIAAARENVPVTVVAAADKLSTRTTVNLESGDRAAVYDGNPSVDVANPTFDVTPAECVTELVTETGSLEVDELEDIVEELRELETWRDR